MNPFLATDGYKTGHHKMYPQGTSLVYSNFTPRSNKYAPKGCDKVVSFGQQMVMQQIKQMFDKHFFKRGYIKQLVEESANDLEYDSDEHATTSLKKEIKESVCQEIKKEYSMYLGAEYDVSHIEALWDLGYLPIEVKAIPEGELVPMGIPVLTIKNTLPEFYWLTNFLETLISNLLWKPITSATIAFEYKKALMNAAMQTDEKNIGFIEFQGHDFSMRGMDSIDATISSGLGHATCFLGSDSLPVIYGAREYYNETENIVHSVNATEHSVMCAGSKEDEIQTFKYLMNQFPTGILSIVSDTWDLWKVITQYLPQLKEEILSRDGKIVIRPDSGNPVDIICGEKFTDSKEGTKERMKGVIELLWDIFGGTVNEQGYKVLNPKIGAIYGDSITLERAKEICERLKQKGFASTNIVLGIGSFTYQYNTRDTFGFAMKATYVEINGSGREIFKNPVTDDGIKKSAKGLLCVEKNKEGYVLLQQCTTQQEAQGALQTIFKNGESYNSITLTQIRKNINHHLKTK